MCPVSTVFIVTTKQFAKFELDSAGDVVDWDQN